MSVQLSLVAVINVFAENVTLCCLSSAAMDWHSAAMGAGWLRRTEECPSSGHTDLDTGRRPL